MFLFDFGSETQMVAKQNLNITTFLGRHRYSKKKKKKEVCLCIGRANCPLCRRGRIGLSARFVWPLVADRRHRERRICENVLRESEVRGLSAVWHQHIWFAKVPGSCPAKHGTADHQHVGFAQQPPIGDRLESSCLGFGASTHVCVRYLPLQYHHLLTIFRFR